MGIYLVCTVLSTLAFGRIFGVAHSRLDRLESLRYRTIKENEELLKQQKIVQWAFMGQVLSLVLAALVLLMGDF